MRSQSIIHLSKLLEIILFFFFGNDLGFQIEHRCGGRVIPHADEVDISRIKLERLLRFRVQGDLIATCQVLSSREAAQSHIDGQVRQSKGSVCVGADANTHLDSFHGDEEGIGNQFSRIDRKPLSSGKGHLLVIFRVFPLLAARGNNEGTGCDHIRLETAPLALHTHAHVTSGRKGSDLGGRIGFRKKSFFKDGNLIGFSHPNIIGGHLIHVACNHLIGEVSQAFYGSHGDDILRGRGCQNAPRSSSAPVELSITIITSREHIDHGLIPLFKRKGITYRCVETGGGKSIFL